MEKAVNTNIRKGLVAWAPVVCLAALVAMLGATPSVAGGKHAHGEGTLNIAVDGNTLLAEIELPADDAVGFEHAPTSKAQVAKIEAAKVKLGDSAKLLTPTPAANCKTTETKIALEGAIGEPFVEGAAKSSADAETHSSISATYQMTCENPAALKQIALGLFKVFPSLAAMEVALVGDRGTKSVEVKRKRARFDF